MSRVDVIRQAAAGHWLEIVTALGIEPRLVDGKNRPCPGCGGSDRFQFNVKSVVGAFSCRHHPDGGGDGFDLVQHAFDVDFKKSAQLVGGVLGLDAPVNRLASVYQPQPIAPPPPRDWSKERNKATRIWNESKPITANDPAGAYLASRRLDLPPDGHALRFHPALPYWKQDDTGQPELVAKLPAMVARIQRPDGMGVGLHRIYLEADGRKFDHDGLPAKKIMKAGELVGAAICLGGPPGAAGLWITEGIEDALTCAQVSGLPAWASLSASLMPSLLIPDTVKQVFIGADSDRAGIEAAHKLASRLVDEGREVRIVAPPYPFKDWNEAFICERSVNHE